MRNFTKNAAFLTALVLFCQMTMAQSVSDFENLILPADSFWNGEDLTGGFTSGDAYFTNSYDTTYDYWSGGFAYSNMKDSITAGSSNKFSAITASGFNGSENYAVGKQGAIVRMTSTNGSDVTGMYVTNSTYAYLSMRDGDAFAKKFGGSTGDDPDWFLLTVFGYSGGTKVGDSVIFYLADYRFTDNSQDYIVNTWKWVDLGSLGTVDSIEYNLSSSDTGQWGMNTPAFFTIDNLNGTAPTRTEHINKALSSIKIYPQPANDYLNIAIRDMKQAEVTVLDLTGRIVLKTEKKSVTGMVQLDIKNIPSGLYLLNIKSDNELVTKKFIRQ